MSIALPTVDLSTAAVNTTGTVSWGNSAVLPRPWQTDGSQRAHITIFNESGCLLLVVLNTSQNALRVPAGAWRTIELGPDDTALSYTVIAVLKNAPISILAIDYYVPGEPVTAIGTLGNSPIGLSGSVSAVTNQVINDGNPAPTVVVEGTPSGGSSSLQLNNDGSGYLSANQITFDNAGNLTALSSVIIGNALVSLIYDSANNALVLRANAANAAQTIAFQEYNGTAVANIFAIGNDYGGAPAHITAAGALGAIAGQATAGKFGVPVIVAQAVRTHITATGNANILTFTPAANGLYRVSGYIRESNGAGTNITASVTWTDPDSGATNQTFYWGASNLNSFAVLAGANDVVLVPLTVFAATSGSIVCKWNDSAGTPNDFVTFIIEQLA